MLVIENLTFSQRLDNINVYAESGQFVHLLGPNGAGKSSLLQIVSGLGIPDTGRVIFDNGDIAQLTMIELARFRCFQEQQQSHIFGYACDVRKCPGNRAVYDPLIAYAVRW